MGDILRPVLDQLRKIWARLNMMPVIRWGTVTTDSPLRVILDGDSDEVLFTPMTVVSRLRVGERVVCVEQHRRIIILGRGKGEPDTGWVDLSSYFSGSFSGDLTGRIVGNVVEIYGLINGAVPSSSTANDFTNALPASFRPSGIRSRWGAVYASGYTGTAAIRPDGTMFIGNRSSATWSSNIQFSVVYLIG